MTSTIENDNFIFRSLTENLSEEDMKRHRFSYFALLILLVCNYNCSKNPNSTVDKQKSPAQIVPTFVINHKNGSYDFAKVSENLAKRLASHISDPDERIRTTAAELLQHLPEYKALIRKIQGMSEGKNLDFILQLHFIRLDDKPDFLAEIAKEAKAARDILTQNHYQMIAVEANYTREVDYESLPQEINDVTSRYRNQITDISRTRGHIVATLPYQGDFQYMSENHKKKVFGFEVDPPQKFLDRVFELRDATPDKTPRMLELWETLQLVISLRSELALARTLERMTLNNQTTGVVMIGFSHIKEMRPMAEAIGLQSRFYVSVRPELQKSIKTDY